MILFEQKKFLSIIFIIQNFAIFLTNCDNSDVDFPPNFKFGATTAAYQIEGAWDTDGKGLSIWDTFTHQHPELIVDNSNADIGPDSYHQFHQDLDALKHLGVQFYRFSISWARVLPTGDVSSFNQAGINYYNDVINKLIENNIEPMVTMYHYDLPDELQKLGGLTNPLIIKYFEEYAKVLYTHFGDRVKYWVTFNEPFDYCVNGYSDATYPPLINAHGVGEYLCIDQTIKSHAVAYRLYKKEFYEKYRGKVGITISSRWYFSKTNDFDLINRGMQFGTGWITHPIYSNTGGYPSIMVDIIGNNSKNEGCAWSRLPDMNDKWKNIIRKSGDFIGLNYYTARYIQKQENPPKVIPSWKYDSQIEGIVDSSWKKGKSSWLYSVPSGLGELLRWLRDQYDNTEIVITENGWSDDGQFDDNDRITYIKEHLFEVSKAIKDGVNISGYGVWSLIDNFEWLLGYTERFGLYYVNFTSPVKKRIPKKSAEFMKTLISTRKLPNI